MVLLQAELEDLCMAVLEPGTYRQVYDEVCNLWGPQQDGLAALNEMSEGEGRSCQEAALQERRASSATASTSQNGSPAQQALDSAVVDALCRKGPRRKGRTVRMSVTPAMMNAIWAARRMTSAAAASASSTAQPQFASAFSSSSASLSSFDSGNNSIPSNSRTGRTLHTRREWAEMKRTQQALQDMLDAQATIDLEAEKGMPWLSPEQRQVSAHPVDGCT